MEAPKYAPGFSVSSQRVVISLLVSDINTSIHCYLCSQFSYLSILVENHIAQARRFWVTPVVTTQLSVGNYMLKIIQKNGMLGIPRYLRDSFKLLDAWMTFRFSDPVSLDPATKQFLLSMDLSPQ